MRASIGRQTETTKIGHEKITPFIHVELNISVTYFVVQHLHKLLILQKSW